MNIAIVPIKKKSERVPGKNFKLVCGKPLFEFLLDKLSYCNFDDIYIDSDSEEIQGYADRKGYKFIERIPELALNSANGNDLLNYHATILEADFYFQLFVTAPLLKVETINQCIDILNKNNHYDSILTSKSLYSWFWFDGKPINYDPKLLPRSQDAKPVIIETTGLYGITSQSVKLNKSRIGNNPYFFEVENDEALDLDNQVDFEYLEFHVAKNISSTIS